MPLRPRQTRIGTAQNQKHAEVDAHDHGNSPHDEGLPAIRPVGGFRLPSSYANRRKSYLTKPFVPTLSTVAEEVEGPEESCVPPPAAALPSPLSSDTTSPQTTEAAGPEEVVSHAMAEALQQTELMEQLQSIGRQEKLYESLAQLSNSGGKAIGSGI